ncbi:MAG: thioredoxin family protein [Synergistaceae bacterium]|nr:thioredoxin family protein [Synergistaceae bacterium]
MKIQILGTGCPKCKKLGELVDQAAKELGINYELEKVTEVAKIVDFGVMTTPALAIDGKVVLAGHLPSYEKIKELLTTAGQVQEPTCEDKGCCGA